MSEETDKKGNELKENYMIARSKLFEVTGNSGKVLKALVNFEEASNILYRHLYLK